MNLLVKSATWVNSRFLQIQKFHWITKHLSSAEFLEITTLSQNNRLGATPARAEVLGIKRITNPSTDGDYQQILNQGIGGQHLGPITYIEAQINKTTLNLAWQLQLAQASYLHYF